MNDLNSFEKEIKQTYRLPEANPAYFKQLEAKLQANQPHPEAKRQTRLSPCAWLGLRGGYPAVNRPPGDSPSAPRRYWRKSRLFSDLCQMSGLWTPVHPSDNWLNR